ncbi:WD40 repeat-like protein [Suillus brevipes Sb2]|nr:WD40 repeat-like protein [Suillus brevipes Sb2]
MAARLFTRWTRKEASTAAQVKGLALKHKLEGHKAAIWNFVFLHDNTHIVSCSVDGTMRKWNYDTGLAVGEPWEGDGGSIYALALSPDGKTIACGREDGSVQQWTTNGQMAAGAWMDHRNERVQSLSWSPNGVHLASGSHDGQILIRNATSGKVEMDLTAMEQDKLYALAYSPSGDKIASGGSLSGDRGPSQSQGNHDNTIYIWNTKTGKLKLVVGPIEGLGSIVTSLVWSSDSSQLYSASDKFARVFNSKSGKLLHRYEHDHSLFSVVLSPKNNVLACVGYEGVTRLWDTKSHQPLRVGLPVYQESLYYVSFSRDGRYLAYGGSDKKITLWTVDDETTVVVVPIPPQQGHGEDGATQRPDKIRRGAQQESRSHSPSSSFLDADATGGDCIIEEAHNDPYNNFFQSSQQSLSSPSPGSHLPTLFSARKLWNVISRRHPPPDESVPDERSKRGFFRRHARSNSPMELATVKSSQSTPEGKLREGEGEEAENIDDPGSTNALLTTRKDKGKQRDYPPADAQSPVSDRTSPAKPNSTDSRNFWQRLVQVRGTNSTFGQPHSSTQPAHVPQSLPRNPWHWNSNLPPVKSSKRPVDIAACREEDRYGIAPESDAEAAAAMLRTNDDLTYILTPGQTAVVAQVSQRRPTKTHPEETIIRCCGFFFGYVRRSNPKSRQL